MVKLMAMVSGVVLMWSALAMRPGEVFDTPTKVALVSALIFCGSVYKDWLDAKRAENSRRWR